MNVYQTMRVDLLWIRVFDGLSSRLLPPLKDTSRQISTHAARRLLNHTRFLNVAIEFCFLNHFNIASYKKSWFKLKFHSKSVYLDVKVEEMHQVAATTGWTSGHDSNIKVSLYCNVLFYFFKAINVTRVDGIL